MTTSQAVAVDVPALSARMRSLGIEIIGDLSLGRVGFGHSNLTYVATDDDGHRWIVRRPPLGTLLASAHDVEREYRILDALGPTDVPVPQMFLASERGMLADVPVIVMEHVDGLVIDGFEALADLDEVVRPRFLQQLALVLASLHGVGIDQVGLEGLASHNAYAPRQLKRWTAQWELSRTRDLPALERLTEVLRRSAPPASKVCLIHGDFSPRNLVMDPESGEIRAVLDWELSTLGDPMADVGTTLAYWTLSDDSAHVGRSARERGEFVEAYLRMSGQTGAFVSYWHALGLWKLAIITEGVMRRAQDEPANVGAMSVPTAAEVERIVEIAADVAHSADIA